MTKPAKGRTPKSKQPGAKSAILDAVAEWIDSADTALTQADCSALRELAAGHAAAGTEGSVAKSIETLADLVSGWIDTEPHSADPVSDWLQKGPDITRTIPVAIVRQLFARLPKEVRETLRLDGLLPNFDPILVDDLVKVGLVRNAQIGALAKQQPRQFFDSGALDFLLEHRTAPPRSVWAAGLPHDRPSGLLPTAEAIADSFVFDLSADAPEWLVSVIVTHGELRLPTLRQVLRERSAFERLVRHIASAGAGANGKHQKAVRSEADAVIPDVAALCVESVRSGAVTANAARWALSHLLLESTASLVTVGAAARQALVSATAEAHLGSLVALLRQSDVTASPEGSAVALLPSTLHAALQQYLAGLAAGDSSGAPLDRAARLQRFLGRRDVLEEFLLLRDRKADGKIPLADFDAALHNVGLRPLPVSEGRTTFQPQLHEALASGILPGDPVTIVQRGWQLGEDEGAITLRRARVSAVSGDGGT